MDTARSNGAIAWALCSLTALIFLAAGGIKLAGRPAMIHEFSQIGLGQWFRYFTGTLEVTGAIGVLIPRFRLKAALLLAIVMVGATIANLTVLRQSPALTCGLFALTLVVAWQAGK